MGRSSEITLANMASGQTLHVVAGSHLFSACRIVKTWLVAIALTATVVAFALEDYFGSSAVVIALGHELAVFGAIVFALKRLTAARGGIATCSQAGAQFGFALTWTRVKNHQLKFQLQVRLSPQAQSGTRPA